MQAQLQIRDNYLGEGRKEGIELEPLYKGVPKEKGEEAKVVKTVDIVGDDSLSQLVSTQAPEKFDVHGKPMQVKEALIYVLEQVKQDPELLEQTKKNVEESKEETEEAQGYRQLVLAMLNEDDKETRKRIEEMDKLEKGWVLMENDGIEPEFPPYVYQEPTWGTTAWNAAKAGGGAAWTVGKFSGKAAYRLYVETARIAPIILLGVMVVENPMFPILKMVVQHVILK